MSKLYFIDSQGGLHVTCSPSDPDAHAFGPRGASRPASNIELGILDADTLVGAEAIEASADHRIIERPDGWQIVVTRFEIAAPSTLWDEDPSGDGHLWWCEDGEEPLELEWRDDEDRRGWAEYRSGGFALQIDPSSGSCWVSERWDMRGRHTFPPRLSPGGWARFLREADAALRARLLSQ